MSENELLTVTSHLYVRLRRNGGRIIDVVWLQRSPDYAREVLRLARSTTDTEAHELADRLEELMTGVPRRRAAMSSATASLLPFSAEVASRYRGALR